MGGARRPKAFQMIQSIVIDKKQVAGKKTVCIDGATVPCNQTGFFEKKKIPPFKKIARRLL